MKILLDSDGLLKKALSTSPIKGDVKRYFSPCAGAVRCSGAIPPLSTLAELFVLTVVGLPL
jgi:hypothetical protein